MRELVRTNDIVLVSAVGALLDGANIHHLVLDQNMSIIEGSLGVLPRRILVHEDDNRQARQLLSDAGLARRLRQWQQRRLSRCTGRRRNKRAACEIPRTRRMIGRQIKTGGKSCYENAS